MKPARRPKAEAKQRADEEERRRKAEGISEEKLAQIRRKQEQFRDALLEVTQLWTRDLDEAVALEAGRRLGLEPVLVSEFLQYWVSCGEGDASWLDVADRIRTQARSIEPTRPKKTSTNPADESGT
jgi:hypothetical protein